MPLFGLRKNKKNEQTSIQTGAQAAKSAASVVDKKSRKVATPQLSSTTPSREVALPSGTFSHKSAAIIRPHVTEKSGYLGQKGVYTFEVLRQSNKNLIREAIKTLYKVTPIKIAIVNLPPRRVFVRGKRGVVPGMKKALITLKKGDTINFV